MSLLSHLDDAAFHLLNAERALARAAGGAPDNASLHSLMQVSVRVRELRIVLQRNTGAKVSR